MTIFPDTNFLLHFRGVDEIDWKALTGEDTVKLIYCRQVVRELDQKKREPRLKSRAERVLKQRDEYQGREVRDGVTVSTQHAVLRNDEFPDDMSPDESDDRILMYLRKYEQDHPDECPVHVITDDHGMRDRCRTLGIPLIDLPEDQRLEPPGDDEQKKIRELEKQLAEHKRRIPDLSLVPMQVGSIPLLGSKPSVFSPAQRFKLFDVDAEMRCLNESYPYIPDSRYLDHPLAPVNRSAADNYNHKLNVFYNKKKKFMEEFNDWLRKRGTIIECDLYLWNTGSCKATDIQIIISFPRQITSIIDLDSEVASELPPLPPDPPEYPSSLPAAAAALMASESWVPSEMLDPTRSRPADVEIGDLRSLNQPRIGHVVKCNVGHLMHTTGVDLCSLLLSFADPTSVKTFEAEYSMLATELPERQKGKLLFKIKP